MVIATAILTGELFAGHDFYVQMNNIKKVKVGDAADVEQVCMLCVGVCMRASPCFCRLRSCMSCVCVLSGCV